MSKIFLRFTVKGDTLNLDELSQSIPIGADVYNQGDVISTGLGILLKPQKTNRWVFSREFPYGDTLNSALTIMKKEFTPHLKQLANYTKTYSSLLDIVIYSEETTPMHKFNASLSKSNLKFISVLNTKLSITIYDW